MTWNLQTAREGLRSMRVELDAMEGRLSQNHQSAETNTSRLADLQKSTNAAIQQLGTRLEETVSRIERDIAAQTAILDSLQRSMAQTDDLIGRIVEGFEAKLGAAQGTVEDNTARVDAVERSIQAATDSVRQVQTEMEAGAAVVQSVRKSMAYTDELVGRVVEAVETILDLNTERS
jgi:chromosome segregation ATPase